MPVASTSAPFPPPIQTPELLSRATASTKRQDPVHNTPADVAAPPKRRRGRPKSTPTPEGSAPTPPAVAAPLPRPMYRGYGAPSVPPQSPATYTAYSDFSPPLLATPPRFSAQNPGYYLPSAPAFHPSPFAYQSPAAGYNTPYPLDYSSPSMFSPAPNPPSTPSSFNYYPNDHQLVSVHGPPDLYVPQMWQDQGRRSQPDLAGGSAQPHFDPNWDGTTRTS
ncbi:hypothetical protein K438DRAFT_188189 [Mycena galopus ATCC 62051]|nr:hypothetical protein K438DRAFT_188189 [Mycena galopus ATCC 62051]